MSKKKKKFIKSRGGYHDIVGEYWGQFFKWLKLKRRGYVKWKKDLFKESIYDE